ncbi:hypothetical protein KL86DES1_21776 [uncultured Desulfovibrio sp.]|uniref:Uncharacterized protein n=1 Tax=uncultured Desulfovibrio sp. TaxID=167968 RepID=A0A212L9C9_9BACT|nr:hypothetical protein KL86DES1_21776 [uncultured Desulfovibrio sp.]
MRFRLSARDCLQHPHLNWNQRYNILKYHKSFRGGGVGEETLFKRVSSPTKHCNVTPTPFRP